MLDVGAERAISTTRAMSHKIIPTTITFTVVPMKLSLQ